MTEPVRPIVPSGSTALERVTDTTFPRDWSSLADAAEPGATTTSTALLPWLAQQWQVAHLAPYFASVPELLDAAIPWLMQRGNAAAVRRALGWLGYNDITLEDIGPWLHLDPGRVVDAAQMQAIAKLVRASIPEHVAFYRVYHGHDARPIVFDRGPALDAGLLDGYSGVTGAAGVLESFGQRAGATLAPTTIGQPLHASTAVQVRTTRYDDMPVLDAWRLDSRVLAATSGGVMELRSSISNAPSVSGGWRVLSQTNARVCIWQAPAPLRLARVTHAVLGRVPMHPPRRWGGPWRGQWREHFQSISRQEP